MKPLYDVCGKCQREIVVKDTRGYTEHFRWEHITQSNCTNPHPMDNQRQSIYTMKIGDRKKIRGTYYERVPGGWVVDIYNDDSICGHMESLDSGLDWELWAYDNPAKAFLLKLWLRTKWLIKTIQSSVVFVPFADDSFNYPEELTW